MLLPKSVSDSTSRQSPAVHVAAPLVATTGASLVALSMAASSSGIGIGYALCLVAVFLMLPMFTRRIAGDWIGIALLALVAWTMAVGLLGPLFSEAVSADARETWHTVRIVGFTTLILGWAIHMGRAGPRWFLALAAIGFGIAMVLEVASAGLNSLDLASRLRYLRSPNQLGLIAATVFFGALAFFGPYVFQSRYNERLGRRALMGLICLVLAFVSLWLLIGSFSRSAWLGATAGAVVVAGGWIAWVVRQGGAWHLPVKAASAVLILIGGVLFLNMDEIGQRLQTEAPTVQMLLSGEYEELPKSSFSARFFIWKEGLELISARPFVGWGGGSISELMVEANEEGRLWSRWGHFHNLYINLGIAVGTPFVLLWLGALAVIWVRGFQYYLREDPPVAWLLLFWGVMFAVASLFQVRMYTTQDSAFFALFTGLAFAGYLKYRWGMGGAPNRTG